MAKRKRRKAGNRGGSSLPGWLYMFFGLGLGLAVAAGIYVNDRRDGTVAIKPEPSSKSTPAKADKAEKEPVKDDSIDFDFYDMLPNLDVEIFEDKRAPRPAANKAVEPQPRVITPGIYILQAGSFTKLVDAQRREGEIALLGVRAEVRKGEANGRIVYRVYSRPLDTPEAVNRLRTLLNDNGIETLAKRVSD